MTVEDSIRFIRQHSRTLAEAGARLSSGEPLHGEAYLAGLRANMPWRLARYLEALRAVSEAEAEMTALGIPFAKSSDHWDETALPNPARARRLRTTVKGRDNLDPARDHTGPVPCRYFNLIAP